MDDTTMYITEIFLNWFYRLITYVKLLICIQAQIRLGTKSLTYISQLCNEMKKKKKYHTFRTVPKSYLKIIKTEAKIVSYNHKNRG